MANFPLARMMNWGMHICRLLVAIKQAQKDGHDIASTDLPIPDEFRAEPKIPGQTLPRS